MIDKYIKAHKNEFNKQLDKHFKSIQFITKEQVKEFYNLATVAAAKAGIKAVVSQTDFSITVNKVKNSTIKNLVGKLVISNGNYYMRGESLLSANKLYLKSGETYKVIRESNTRNNFVVIDKLGMEHHVTKSYFQ